MPKPQFIQQLEEKLKIKFIAVDEIKADSGNKFEYTTDAQQNITGLKISKSKFNTIPTILAEEAKELEKLNILDLSENNLFNIEPLQVLKNIKTLNLNKNRIKTIWHLRDLSKLEYLDLSQNKIGSFWPSKELPNLKTLNIKDNAGTQDFTISNIGFLKKCNSDVMINNDGLIHIIILEDEFMNHILYNEIFTEFINSNKNYENICFHYAKHNVIACDKMKNFKPHLVISDRQRPIGGNIEFNDNLRKNKLYPIKILITADSYKDGILDKEINGPRYSLYMTKPFTIEKLKTTLFEVLDLITFIKEKIGDEDFHEYMSKIPDEIVEKGFSAIRDWSESVKTENNEIKLILTGNTTAGKTSLINMLLKGVFKDLNNSTHGIKVHQWKVGKLNINIWDFGGQEYYHATHRLFLTHNTVYLLLWEKLYNKTGILPTIIQISGKKEPEVKDLQHYDYSYWLQLIRRYTSEESDFEFIKDTSPIYMIQNKIDEPGNTKEPTNHTLMNKYAVKEDFHLSLKKSFEEKNTEGNHALEFKVFKSKLMEGLKQAAQKQEIQEYIAEIRKAIRDNSFTSSLTWGEYKSFCQRNTKTKLNDKKMKILTQYLHDTGIILYFGYDPKLEKNSILLDTVFMDPNYVCDMIYRILDYNVQENAGKFTKQHVIHILKKEAKAQKFIALMQSPNFELIYKHPKEKDSFVAPQYLPDDNPERGSSSFLRATQKMKLSFVIKINYCFSSSIMTRFIARHGFDAYNNTIWKYGIIYQKNFIDIFVECDFQSNKIYIKTHEPYIRSHIVKEALNDFIQIYGSVKGFDISLNDEDFDKWYDVYRYKLITYSFLLDIKRIDFQMEENQNINNKISQMNKVLQKEIEYDKKFEPDGKTAPNTNGKIAKEKISIVRQLLEKGELEDAISELIEISKNTSFYSYALTLKTSYKDFERKSMAGYNVSGKLEEITYRFAETLNKFEYQFKQ